MFSETDDGELYAAAATDGEDKGAMLVYFTNRPDAEPKTVEIDAEGTFDVHILSGTEDDSLMDTLVFPGKLTMMPNTVLRLREAVR